MACLPQKGKLKIFTGGFRTKKTRKDRREEDDDDYDIPSQLNLKNKLKTKDDSMTDLDSTQVSSETEVEPRSRSNKSYNHSSGSSGLNRDSFRSGRNSISSTELKALLTNREENSRRRMIYLEEVVARKDRETEKLRWQRREQERRIHELEAMNALLRKEARQQRRPHSRTAHSPVEYRDGSGQSSRSKASIMQEEEEEQERRRQRQQRQQQEQAITEDDEDYNWSVSKDGSDDEDPYYDNDEPEKPSSDKNLMAGRSGNHKNQNGSEDRSLRRSRSETKLVVGGGKVRSLRSKSPSSTRGFGKQSGGRVRAHRDAVQASREKRERHGSTRRSKNSSSSNSSSSSSSSKNDKRSLRSRSPRTYLRRED